MDNKQAIEWLEYIQNEYSWSANCDKAIDKAITSLEAWDKVKEDIKYSQFIFLDGNKEIECIPIFEVMNIINRNLGGEVIK